jgi:hypothetical protein
VVGLLLELLWQARILQNAIGGMATEDVVGDEKITFGDKAIPNLMATLFQAASIDTRRLPNVE